MRRAEAKPQTSGIGILGRLLGNGKEQMAPSVARHILRVQFTDEDKARMSDLATRNQQGDLSADERDELTAYANAGCLLGILHSRARRSLRKVSKN